MKTLAIVLCGASVLSAQTGRIIGTVTDGSGAAVSGANVSASLRSPVQPGTPVSGTPPAFMPFAATTFTGSKGEFQIDKLPAGTYTLCVENRAASLLNPCIWSDTHPTTIVGAGATVSGVNVVAQKGVTVKVRVNDAGGLLAKDPSKDDILIGTGHGISAFVPALVAGRDATGKTMTLVVPAGQPVNISASSATFKLADDKGSEFAAMGASLPLPIQAAPALGAVGAPVASAPALTVHVTGLRPKP